MAIEAGRVVLRVVADTGDVGKQIGAAADDAGARASSRLSSLSSRMSDVGKKASLALTLPIGAAAVTSVNAAGDVVEAQNKVRIVFGDSADEVERFADRSAQSLGISKRAALDATGTFGNLLRATGLGAGKAADLSVNMTKLGGDLASFNNSTPEEALDALRAGLVGETEPLKRFGVNLSAARIEAEALALGLAKPTKNAAQITAANVRVTETTRAYNAAVREHGKDSLEAQKAAAALGLAQDGLKRATAGTKPQLTDAAKAQAAYSVIMKDTKLAQGDFQRSLSTSAANQERVSRALADDAQANIGATLLPLWQSAIQIVGKVAGAIAGLPAPARNAAVGLALAAAATGPLLVAGSRIITVSRGIGTATSATAGAVRGFAAGFRNVNAAFASNASVATRVGAAIRSQGQAWRASAAATRASVGASLASARASAAGAAASARARAATVAHTAAEKVRTVATKVGAVASRVAAVALRGVGIALRFAMGPIGLIITAIGLLVAGFVLAYKKSATFRNIVNGAISGVAKVGRAILSGFAAFFKAVWRGIVTAVTTYVRVYKTVVTTVFRAVLAVIRGALNAAKAVVSAVWRAISAVVRGAVAVVKAVVSAGFRAVSAVIRSVMNAAKAVVSAVWRGIVAVIRTAITTALAVIRGISKVAGWFRDAFNKAKTAVSTAISAVIGFFRALPGKIIGALGNVGSMLLGVGKDIVGGLINGIKSMAGSVISAVKSTITDKLPGFAKKALGIGSPSKVFRSIGRDVVAGLVQGVDKSAGDIRAASEKIAERLADAWKGTPLVERRSLALLQHGTKRLAELARQREKISGQIGKAREKAAEREKEAREYASGVAERIRGTGDITGLGAVDVTGAIAALRQRVDAAKAFAGNLATLRKRNLDPALVRQLADAGVEQGAAMAQALADADPSEIGLVESLTKQLAKAGEAAGQTARDVLYAPGVAAARGLSRGVESQLDRIRATMRKVAAGMAGALRRALGIRSPSRLMARLGTLTARGFAVGVEDTAGEAHAAMRRLVSLPSPDLSSARVGPAGAGQGVTVNQTVNGSDRMSAGELAHTASRELAWKLSSLSVATG